jgi:hypothetical protein
VKEPAGDIAPARNTGSGAGGDKWTEVLPEIRTDYIQLIILHSKAILCEKSELLKSNPATLLLKTKSLASLRSDGCIRPDWVAGNTGIRTRTRPP